MARVARAARTRDRTGRDDGYAATVRWAVPFFLRWVAGSPRYGALLRPELAAPPVTVEMAPPGRNP